MFTEICSQLVERNGARAKACYLIMHAEASPYIYVYQLMSGANACCVLTSIERPSVRSGGRLRHGQGKHRAAWRRWVAAGYNGNYTVSSKSEGEGLVRTSLAAVVFCFLARGLSPLPPLV